MRVSERHRGKSESEEREREREKVRGGERDIRENQCCVHQGQNVMTLFSFFFFLLCGIMEGWSLLLQESPCLMEGGREEEGEGEKRGGWRGEKGS